MPLTPTTGFVHIGELFVCNCGIPLAKKTGPSDYEFIKNYGGKPVAIKIKLGDFTQVNCEVCKRGFAFIRVREHMSIVDNVKVAGKPSGDIVKE